MYSCWSSKKLKKKNVWLNFIFKKGNDMLLLKKNVFTWHAASYHHNVNNDFMPTKDTWGSHSQILLIFKLIIL